MPNSTRKQGILLFILITLLGTLALGACSGSAVIDVNVDPNTGQGNIVVSGDEPSNDGVDVDITTDDNNQDMSQILLFGIVVALLLGTVAIVVSTSRRERA